jgi:hypothetical protein
MGVPIHHENIELKLVEYNCTTCNVSFFVAEGCHRELYGSHRTFYCPNGHSLHFPGETEKKEERKKLEEELSKRYNEDIKRASQKILRHEENIKVLRNTITSLSRTNRTYKGHITRCKAKILELNERIDVLETSKDHKTKDFQTEITKEE